jgi:hypothetical protein
MGRLLVNAGILNLNQAGGATNNVREAQDALKTALDTAAKNTGITYTPTAPGDTTSILNGILQTNAYALPSGQSNPFTRPNDTPGSPQTVTFRAQERVVTLSGYYGMGDPAGSYGATIILQGERWLRGEAQFLDWTDNSALATVGFNTVFQGTPQVRTGAKLSLRDNDTDAVIGTDTTSNLDGWARILSPYGVNFPYSNLPKSSLSWSTRQQYTASGGNVTSTTTLGKLFNSYWLVSAGLVVKDSTNHALIAVGSAFRLPITVLDRLPCYYDISALPSARGIDLARDARNWLYRSYRTDSPLGVTAGRLFLGGTWSDVSVATDCDGAALPTLAVHPNGTVVLLYHNSSGQGRLWWSTDAGATWSDRGTLTGVGEYPRAALLQDNSLLIASYISGGITVHRSTDWQTATPPTVSAVLTVSSVPEQLPALQVDRWGIAHLVYADGTNLQHRHSTEADVTNWSAAVALGAGENAAYAPGIDQAVFARWDSSTAHLEFTKEDYEAASSFPAMDLTGFTPTEQYLGLVWEAGQRIILAALDASGNPLVYYSPERHTLTTL